MKKSAIYTTLLLGADEDMAMPLRRRRWKSQIEVIKTWIEQGAEWPEGVVLEQTPRIKFEKHIQPILEQNCVSCHNADKAKGDWIITTKKEAFSTGENAPT
ncbi:hypothetical protein [Prosthecobacter sp.]|uniref:hypothetical protein n=1 Tax=Prosthecobacter sp. TaxID=1965333 RepID=UPI003783C781